PLIDPVCTALVSAERLVSKALGGSCQVPIAGYATLNDAQTFTLRGLVASPDGKAVIQKSADASLQNWETAANVVIEGLLQEGAQALIESAVEQFKG
ncbi:MAG: hydroxymethylbilane synthase, partial [Limnobacter sp.]